MKNRALVLLSGEGSTVPAAEAKALFLAYDPSSEFDSPEPRLLVVRTSADPFRVGSRIAFARRVGRFIEDAAEAADLLAGRRVRFRSFDLRSRTSAADPAKYLAGLRVTVDLRDPEYEITLVRGGAEFLAVTSPGKMSQRWAERRPRKRPFFHPSAIFPKLSRALVNLSRCREREVFLDPFCGTGSIPIEAQLVGARVVAADLAQRMVQGALQNMKHFGQDWLGVIRADSAAPVIGEVDAVATDIPYGRASSTRGSLPAEIVAGVLPRLATRMKEGALFVLMHPQSLRISPSSEFALLEEHHLHVHKLLTRTISVLERR